MASNSFNQQTLQYAVQNGNSVQILIGDITVGFGQTVATNLSYGAQQVYGIGSANPQDVQQLRLSPSINIDSFMLTPSGIKFLKYPSTMSQVLANNQFNIHVMGQDNSALASYVGCVAETHNLNVPANSLVTETINFLARDVLGPDGNSIMAGNNAISAAAIAGAALNTLGL